MTRIPGTLVAGRYRLERQIGGGGFGDVFEALDQELERRVAIKILTPAASSRGKDREFRERFRREAIATAKIEHPSVVTIYDVGTLGEREEVFLVMELLSGHSFIDLLAQHPHGMAPQRMLPHFVDVLEALGDGHALGIVHKDLKPSNLFMTSGTRERLRLIDFGVARVLHEERLTATGRIVGSPRYLAPEYIEQRLVTPALDVYQMGLIIVETLTGVGCVPAGLQLLDCCQRHLNNELEIPAEIRDSPLGPVIERATARHPGDRYSSGHEFSAALAAVEPSSLGVGPEAKTLVLPRAVSPPVVADELEPDRIATQPFSNVRGVDEDRTTNKVAAPREVLAAAIDQSAPPPEERSHLATLSADNFPVEERTNTDETQTATVGQKWALLLVFVVGALASGWWIVALLSPSSFSDPALPAIDRAEASAIKADGVSSTPPVDPETVPPEPTAVGTLEEAAAEDEPDIGTTPTKTDDEVAEDVAPSPPPPKPASEEAPKPKTPGKARNAGVERDPEDAKLDAALDELVSESPEPSPKRWNRESPDDAIKIAP